MTGLTGLYAFWNNKEDNILLGCIMASIVTRSASNMAYKKNKFSLTAFDVTYYIADAFEKEFL